MIILFSFILRNRSHNVDAGILKHECGWLKEPGFCDLFDRIPSSSTCWKWNYRPEKLPRLITQNLFKQVYLCRRLQRGLAELLPKGAVSSSGWRFPPIAPLLSRSGWVTVLDGSIQVADVMETIFFLYIFRGFLLNQLSEK